MDYYMDSDLIDAVSWLAGEFSQLIEDPFSDYENEYPIVTITKTSSEFIPCWSSIELKNDEIVMSTSVPKFTVNEEINKKIYVGSCDILSLEVDSIAVFLEESNKYKSKLAKRVVIQSGGQIDYDRILRLRSGESLLARVYNVGTDNVIFAMVSHFSSKYHEASSNILNMTIRDCLKSAIEKGIEVIAFPVSIDDDVYYPMLQFLDTLLRTLRRWLELPEINSKIRRIYLITHVASSYDDSTVSSSRSLNCMQVVGSTDNSKNLFNLLRRYFPKNSYDELLSADLTTSGDVNGEISSEERKIRISGGFESHSSKPLLNLGESLRVSNDSKSTQEDSDYAYYLKLSYSISRLPIYKEFERSKFVVRCGNDREKRPVIAINAKSFNTAEYTYSLCYILGVIKPFIQHKFVIAVVNLDHSMINSTTLLKLLRDLCEVFGEKRTKNIAAIYFHRCSWALRSYLFLISTFLPTEVWDAAVFVDSFKEIAHLGLDPCDF
nr:hypothetical protein MACL_00000971 [Theileria orientalis]